MIPYKCYNEHVFESDDVESYFPKCPTCGASSKPQGQEPDLFMQSTVLEDLALIDSILAESSAPDTSASVPDAGGFSGFDGGSSGGGGASDSFDGGGGDSSV